MATDMMGAVSCVDRRRGLRTGRGLGALSADLDRPRSAFRMRASGRHSAVSAVPWRIGGIFREGEEGPQKVQGIGCTCPGKH